MTPSGSYHVAYEIDTCPRCGEELGGPDDNLDRHCYSCGVTVKAALVTWEIIE